MGGILGQTHLVVSSINVGSLLGASKVSRVLGGMAGSSILGRPWLCLCMETINVGGGGDSFIRQSHPYVGSLLDASSGPIHMCVYILGVYSHEVHLCVCTCFRVYTQRYIQRWYVYVYMVTYIHRGSTRGCVSGYVFTYIHTEFTSVCIYSRIYVCVYN